MGSYSMCHTSLCISYGWSSTRSSKKWKMEEEKQNKKHNITTFQLQLKSSCIWCSGKKAVMGMKYLKSQSSRKNKKCDNIGLLKIPDQTYIFFSQIDSNIDFKTVKYKECIWDR